MAESVTQLIDRFIQALRQDNTGIDVAVILVGSVARGTSTGQSDLALVVLSETKLKLPRFGEGLHVQRFTTDEFRARLTTGDDFAAWSVRFGVPIVTSPIWTSLVESEEARGWPDWRTKVGHTMRRLLLANTLHQTRDIDAALEEMSYAITHLGRALLFKDAIFPLSRPEMVNQLRETGHPALAGLLDILFTERRHHASFAKA